MSLLDVPDKDEHDEETRCHAFVEGEYDEDEYDDDTRCDAFVADEYNDDTRRYSLLRKQFLNVKLSNQRM